MSKGGKFRWNISKQVIANKHQSTKACEIGKEGGKQPYKLSFIQYESYYTMVVFVASHLCEVAHINSLIPVIKGGIGIMDYGFFECQESSLICKKRVIRWVVMA